MQIKWIFASKLSKYDLLGSKKCLKGISLRNCQKMQFLALKNVDFSSKNCRFFQKKKLVHFAQKLLILQEKKLKLSQNLSKVSERNQDFCCRKNLNFQWKREKISKNLSKIVRFCRKKVQVFSKIVKSARKKSQISKSIFSKKNVAFCSKNC